MNNGILGNALTEVVMEKVVRDKIKSQLKGDAPPSHQPQKSEKQCMQEKQRMGRDSDEDPDFDENDEEMVKIMNQMKMEKLKQAKQTNQNQSQEYGEYREIVESEFLNYVTKNEFAVVHFYHKDFERCKIVDNHLRLISQQHSECKFLYMNAEKSPFFVTKLAVQMLPTIVCFINGVAKDKIIGFSDFNSKDDFKTIEMTRRLVKAGVIKPKNKSEKLFNLNLGGGKKENDDSDEDC